MGSRHHLYCGSDRERVNYRAASAPPMQHLPLIAAPHSPPAAYTIDSGPRKSEHLYSSGEKRKKKVFFLFAFKYFVYVFTYFIPVETEVKMARIFTNQREPIRGALFWSAMFISCQESREPCDALIFC